MLATSQLGNVLASYLVIIYRHPADKFVCYVTATMTFAEKILQARPESCAIPLQDGGNRGLKSKFYFENGLLRPVSKAM